MSVHPCCVTCPGCGGKAYCPDEGTPPPCPHDTGLCGNCNLREDGCLDCKLDAEREMHASGDYDPAADPFFRHDITPSEPPRNPYFDPATNSYRFPKDAS